MSSRPMPASLPQKQAPAPRLLQHPTFVCVLLAVVTLLAFWPVFQCGFINYDDTDYVTANPYVLTGLTIKNAAWAFGTFHASNWHPLTWLSHMLDVELFGKGPAGPHAVNLVFHIFNTLLLFFLLRMLTGAQWPSALVSALFALHPLHVESVAWIAERKDVLSTFFALLALCAYGQFAKKGASSRVWYGTAILFFALGLMSKPMLVTLPFIMLLLDYWPLNRFGQSSPAQTRVFNKLLLEKVPFFALSAAVSVLTMKAQHSAIQTLEHLRLPDRIANVFVAYAGYLGKTIWPSHLALPYLHPGHWPMGQVMLAAALLIALSGSAWLVRRKYPYVLFGWLWFLGTLIPVIGLVQVGAQSMADRYTYIPLIGLFIILVWSVKELKIPRPVFAAGAISLLATCAMVTRNQAACWHDSERLFKHATAVTKDNFVAQGNVGGALFESGRLEEAMEYYQRSYQSNPRYAEALNSIGAVLASRGSEEAIEWFQKALALQPNHADALFNLGNALAKKGNAQEAKGYFEASLKVKPANYEARNNLANALFKLGDIDGAIVQYRAALDSKPDAALIRKNLGEMLAAQGKLDEAITQYRQALQYTNDALTHYSLGLALALQDKWDEAIEHYSETLRLAPANSEAHYNLGYALKVKGRNEPAIAALSEALRLQPEFPLAHYNLGCILADQGQHQKAITHLREALSQRPDYKEAKERLRSLEERK